MYFPEEETVLRGYKTPQHSADHYVRIARYPEYGGYRAFANALLENANVRYGAVVTAVDLRSREIHLADGTRHRWRRLINTFPLPEFVQMTGEAPPEVLRAAETLQCTSLLLVNVTADRTNAHPFHWFYVYDEDKLATRVHA